MKIMKENTPESGPEYTAGKDSEPDQEQAADPGSQEGSQSPAGEVGGRDGPDPTRYGDWEKNGRCIDF